MIIAGLVTLGIVFLAICGTVVFYMFKNKKNEN
jgi:hypothetical protein